MRGTLGAPFSPESIARIEAITTIGEVLPLLMASCPTERAPVGAGSPQMRRPQPCSSCPAGMNQPPRAIDAH